MAANLSLGVQYAAGIVPFRRNLVTQKPKATMVATYASKNPNQPFKHATGALVPFSKPRNFVVRASNGEDSDSTETPVPPKSAVASTTCIIDTTGLKVRQNAPNDWNGKGKDVQFLTHTGDQTGSIAGLWYTIGDSVNWIVAWSNKPASADNKVYTKIMAEDPKWDDIRKYLENENTDNKSDDGDPILGYRVNVEIDNNTDTPTLLATCREYKGGNVKLVAAAGAPIIRTLQ